MTPDDPTVRAGEALVAATEAVGAAWLAMHAAQLAAVRADVAARRPAGHPELAPLERAYEAAGEAEWRARVEWERALGVEP